MSLKKHIDKLYSKFLNKILNYKAAVGNIKRILQFEKIWMKMNMSKGHQYCIIPPDPDEVTDTENIEKCGLDGDEEQNHDKKRETVT